MNSCMYTRDLLCGGIAARGIIRLYPHIPAEPSESPGAAAAAQIMPGPVESAITAKLQAAFEPEVLQVLNESRNHNVPKDAETHFKVIVVSATFGGVGLLDRHRRVNGVLAEELEGPVHALSIQAKTPEQWAKSGGVVPASPACLGGGKA